MKCLLNIYIRLFKRTNILFKTQQMSPLPHSQAKDGSPENLHIPMWTHMLILTGVWCSGVCNPQARQFWFSITQLMYNKFPIMCKYLNGIQFACTKIHVPSSIMCVITTPCKTSILLPRISTDAQYHYTNRLPNKQLPFPISQTTHKATLKFICKKISSYAFHSNPITHGTDIQQDNI